MPELQPLTTSRKPADPDSPTLWHRRLAHLVAHKWGVQMEAQRNLSEGLLDGKRVAIRCAKSKTPPITVSGPVLERVHVVWGVFLTQTDSAEIYALSAKDFRRIAYFYSPRSGYPLYSARLSRFSRRAELIGTLSSEDIEAIGIP